MSNEPIIVVVVWVFASFVVAVIALARAAKAEDRASRAMTRIDDCATRPVSWDDLSHTLRYVIKDAPTGKTLAALASRVDKLEKEMGNDRTTIDWATGAIRSLAFGKEEPEPITLFDRIAKLELVAKDARNSDIKKQLDIANSRCPDGDEHDKVYWRDFAGDEKPWGKWVCRKCGMTGFDNVEKSEYDRLMEEGKA